jgi:hypothetical protein
MKRRKPTEQHTLKIESFRDAVASCSCGRWSYTAPTFDREPDEKITARIKEAHRQHVTAHRLTFAEPSASERQIPTQP